MGHFDGRLKDAVDKAIEHAKDKAFYGCLTAHGFYDVADPNNGLKDWERASVPSYNQNRMSALADAIADMIRDVLANPEYGILTGTLEDIVNKIDMRGSMTAGEMDVVGGALGGLTGGSSEAARQAMSAQVAAAMGGFKFDPDVIPPISLGLSGLPFSISNCYKPGMLAPNYDFLYEHETDKHDGFYEKDGKLYVGAGIPVDLGGPVKILVLRTIFGVPNVDKDSKPQGDIEGGLTMEEFETIKNVMDMTPDVALARDDVKAFRMTDVQVRSSFYRFMHFILWQPLSNPNNWGYLHWGALANNACPEPIRTALCSFLRTNGLALDPANGKEACMISFCLNAGMAYYIGRDTPVTLVGVTGQDITAWDPETKQDIQVETGKAKQYPAVKKNKDLAFLHFTWIADILSHMTNGTSVNDTALRKRRVAEANLIYGFVGLPQIPYGEPLGEYPSEVTGTELEKRGVTGLMTGSTIYVYPNKASQMVATSDVKLVYQSKDIDPEGKYMHERSRQVLQYAGALAGIKTLSISSLYRNPYKQGTTMAYNWHQGNRISYQKGGGKYVNAVYIDDVPNHPGKKPGYLDDEYFKSYTVKAMAEKAVEVEGKGIVVSQHCQDPARGIQAIDLSWKDLERKYHYPHDQVLRLGYVFQELKDRGILRKYLEPKAFTPPPKKGNGEPAFHIEVWTTGKNSRIPLDMAESDPSGASPGESDREVTVSIPTFSSAVALDAVYIKDFVDTKKES